MTHYISLSLHNLLEAKWSPEIQERVLTKMISLMTHPKGITSKMDAGKTLVHLTFHKVAHNLLSTTEGDPDDPSDVTVSLTTNYIVEHVKRRVCHEEKLNPLDLQVRIQVYVISTFNGFEEVMKTPWRGDEDVSNVTLS